MPNLPSRPPFKITALVAAGVLLAGTAAALAAGDRGHGPGHGGPMLRMLDANEDGRIDRDEFDAPHRAAFAKADANNNQKLELDEMAAYMEARKQLRREAHFKRLDKNGDGALDEQEMRAVSDRRWSRLDADGDGALTVDDIGSRRRRHRR